MSTVDPPTLDPAEWEAELTAPTPQMTPQVPLLEVELEDPEFRGPTPSPTWSDYAQDVEQYRGYYGDTPPLDEQIDDSLELEQWMAQGAGNDIEVDE